MATILENPTVTGGLSLALDRLLLWQASQFENRDQEELVPESTVDPVLGDRFHRFQRAVDFVLNDEVLRLLSRPIGYITALHPYEPRYSTAALFGDWPDWRREIWRDWMGPNRSRPVSEGRLFRHAYGLSFGMPLVTSASWIESTDLVSPHTRGLDLGFAAVLPLVHERAYLGLLTIGFDSPDARSQALDTIHKLAQWVLVPLLQPESQAISERSLTEGVTRIYRPIMWRVREALGTYSARFNEKARELGQTRSRITQRMSEEGRRRVDTELNQVQTLMQRAAIELRHEGERGLSMIHNLAPWESDSPLAMEQGETSALTLTEIVSQVMSGLGNDPEGEFNPLVRPGWLHTEFPPDFAVPLSRPQVEVIFEELLRNSFRAISQQIAQVKQDTRDPDAAFTGPEVIAAYVAFRGREPMVRVIGETRTAPDGSDRPVLRVWDNGIGMPREILARVEELGFSTKPEGTGTGLNIVRAVAGLRGARVRVTSSAARDDTDPQDIYSEIILSF